MVHEEMKMVLQHWWSYVGEVTHEQFYCIEVVKGFKVKSTCARVENRQFYKREKERERERERERENFQNKVSNR